MPRRAARSIVPPVGDRPAGTLKGTSIDGVSPVNGLLFPARLIYHRTYPVTPLPRVAANAPELYAGTGLDIHPVDPYPTTGGRVWRCARRQPGSRAGACHCSRSVVCGVRNTGARPRARTSGRPSR